jgi:spermidine synthase
LPFFFGGLCISLPLSHFPKQVSRIYFFDLIGASLGCLLTIGVLNIFGGPSAVLFVAVLGSLSSVLMSFATPRRNVRILSGIGSLFFIGVLVFNMVSNAINVSYAKGEYEPQKYYERWNTFSRIVVIDPPKGSAPVWGLSPSYTGGFPPFYLMNIDAQAGTPITKFTGDYKELEYLKWDVSTAVHSVKQNARELIIGAGGGKDILAGLLFNQKEVVGVEINSDIINAVKGQFGDFSGHFYDDPRVKIVLDEGRTYLAQTSEKFDIIQASMIDSWAATSAGAFVLTENSLYTKEAFKIYWDKLNEGGILTMSRFYLDNRPDETMRLLTLSMSSWEEEGIADPRQNIAVLFSDGVATLLLKKGAGFTKDEVSALQKRADQYGFSLLYAPGAQVQGPKGTDQRAQPIQDLMKSPDYSTFVKNYPLDISPPSDNRPFFFHTLRFGDSLRAMLGLPLPTEASKVHSKAPLTVLGALLIIVTTLAAIFIFAPLLALRRKKKADLTQTRKDFRGNLPFIAYFFLLGLGFIMVEIPLMQRFSLFLGHPVYSLSITLFSLLLFSSVGSFLTGRVRVTSIRKRVVMVGIGLSILIPVYIVLLPVVLSALVSLPIIAKAVITVILLSPLGLLMGMPFPLGIRLMSEKRSWMVPWVWGINGALSVVASVLSVIVAIYNGFSTALIIGALSYFGVLLLALLSRALRENVAVSSEGQSAAS